MVNISSIWSSAVSVAKSVAAAVVQKVQQATAVVKSVIGTVRNAASVVASAAATTAARVVTAAKAVASTVKTAVSNVVSSVTSAVSGIVKSATQTISNISTPVVAITRVARKTDPVVQQKETAAAATNITDTAKKTGDTEAPSNIITTAGDIAAAALNTVVQAVKDVWQNPFINILKPFFDGQGLMGTKEELLRLEDLYRTATGKELTEDALPAFVQNSGTFNFLAVILNGVDLQGKERSVPTAEETFDYVSTALLLQWSAVTLAGIGAKIIGRSGAIEGAKVTENVAVKYASKATTAVEKKGLAAFLSGAIKAIAADFKKQPVSISLLGIFALTEIPNYFNMRTFARKTVSETQGLAPDQITFPLSEKDKHFNALMIELGKAIQAKDKNKAADILRSMKTTRAEFSSLLDSKKKVLEDIGLLEAEQGNLAFFDDIIIRSTEQIAAMPEAAGTLEVASNVEASEVFIDGIKKGLTPLTLTFAPGAVHIIVTKFGYTASETDLVIKTGETSFFEGKIQQKGTGEETGVLRVSSNVAASDVYVNGAKRGLVPFEKEFTPGSYKLLVTKWGYTNWEADVVIAKDKLTIADAQIVYITAKGQSKISIDSEPGNAAVFVDGVVWKYRSPTIVEVEPGVHVVILKASYYKNYAETVNVAENETVEINAVMKLVEELPPWLEEKEEAAAPTIELWKVTVNSEPSGAKILINSSIAEREGYTLRTPEFVILAKGTYFVTVDKTGYERPEAKKVIL